MGRLTIRVLALASCMLACLAFGALAGAVPGAATDGDADQPSEPTTVAVPSFVEIAAGHQHACGRTKDGAVWCWWYGDSGQLGNGTSTGAYEAPVQVVDLPAAAAIEAGGNSTCAIDDGGGLWCWGDNSAGQLGDGTTEDRARPVRVVGLERPVIDVSMGGERACAVLEDGSAWCWGDNDDGRLGDGSEQSSPTPVRVTVVGMPVTSLAVGGWHTCALADDGSVWCWGTNWQGALGAGDTERHDGAVQVAGLGGSARAITAGYAQACALRDDGAVLCWGDNTANAGDTETPGTLGVGSGDEFVASPRQVVGLPAEVTAIDTSTWSTPHIGALAADGSVWTWGENEDAAVGPGAAVPVQETPIRAIAGGTDGLAVGGDVTAVLLDSGDARWWGDGDPNPRIPWTGATVVPTGYRPTGPLVPTITTQIPTPADVSTDPPVVGANLLLAAIAMIAFTIAIELLNRTLADAEPILRRRVGPLSRLDRARARVDEALSGRLGRGRAADAARVVGIAAFYGLVFALLDPTWDPLSVTGLWLVLSFAVACGLVGIADDVATWTTARRWGVASEMGVRPGSLVAALASTVATRTLVLVPGVMIGTPEALEVDEERLDRPRRGRLAAMGLGAVGVVGGLAWLITLAAGPLASAVPGAAAIVRGLEAFLLLVFAVAVQNGFVQLLAFRDSAGRALFHVSKVAWGVALLIVTFVFWHTLVNPQGDLAEALGSTNVQAFMATVGVVLAVAAGAWLVALVARRRSSAGAAALAPASPVIADAIVAPGLPAVAAAPVLAVAPAVGAEPTSTAPPSPLSLDEPPAPAPAPAAERLVVTVPAPTLPAPAAAPALAMDAARPVAIEPLPAPPAAALALGSGAPAGRPGGGVAAHSLHVPGNRRLAGPARLAISPERLELDGGWVDLAADRLAAVVTTVIVVALVVPAVPIVVAAADGRFHPERVPWLPEAMILVPALAVIAAFLVRRWRDGRRLPQLTSCPALAAEARPTVDRDTALLAGLLGSSLAVVAWLLGATTLVQVAAGAGGAMVCMGLHLAVAGRNMVVVRAPLDPERRGSVVLSLKARDREAATKVVAAIRDAQHQSRGAAEVAR